MNRGIIQLCILCCITISATAQVDAYSGATKPVADTVKKESVKKKSKNDEFESFRFGGYGEMLAKRMDYGINRFYGGKDGNSKTTRSSVSIPRFVLAFDYKFNDKWELGSEIEFEAGGTGQAVELENSENGEYETEIEKGGEVALEQFHVTRYIVPAFNVRAGHIIVPVGLTNYSHEPINFLGTSRPEGETTLLPSTWHETGISFFGECPFLDYEAMIVAGLNANGFDRNSWVAGGKQGLFEEDNFNSPAYVARINYKGINNLRIGGSIYYCNSTGSNSDKEQTYSAIDNTSLLIWSADAQLKSKFVVARANVLMGNLNGSEAITGKNAKLSNKSPYSRTGAVAKKAVAYGAECGIHVNEFFNNENVPVITPFARYEYYNPQEEGEGSQTMDARCQVSKWTFGLNWNILPNLVVKVDYTTRQIGTNDVFGTGQYNSENEFAVGLAYVDWFYKK